jgi:hypothetical protein
MLFLLPRLPLILHLFQTSLIGLSGLQADLLTLPHVLRPHALLPGLPRALLLPDPPHHQTHVLPRTSRDARLVLLAPLDARLQLAGERI